MKHALIFVGLAGFILILGTGCYSTPDQQLARSTPMTGGNHGNSPAWSWSFVPAKFEGTDILLNPNYKVVKAWRTEESDHQTVQVTYDVVEDAFGRPIMILPCK